MGMSDIAGVMAARAAILERSATIGAGGAMGLARPAAAGTFGAVIDRAMRQVSASQNAAGAASAAFERGDTDDIAVVMLARQTAAIEFQATLQVRNRLLSAYRDIMNMPV